MPNRTELEELRRRVLDPFRSNLEPAIMADAFLTTAKARGIITRPENIGAAHHRIGPARDHIEAPMAENVIPLADMQQVETIRSRIPEHVRRILSRPFGGDAA